MKNSLDFSSGVTTIRRMCRRACGFIQSEFGGFLRGLAALLEFWAWIIGRADGAAGSRWLALISGSLLVALFVEQPVFHGYQSLTVVGAQMGFDVILALTLAAFSLLHWIARLREAFNPLPKIGLLVFPVRPAYWLPQLPLTVETRLRPPIFQR